MYVCLCKVHLYDSTSTVRPGKKGRTVEMAFPLRLSQVKGKRRGGRVRTHSRDLISCTKFFEVEGTWGPQPGVRSPRGIYCNIFDALKNNRKKRIGLLKDERESPICILCSCGKWTPVLCLAYNCETSSISRREKSYNDREMTWRRFDDVAPE